MPEKPRPSERWKEAVARPYEPSRPDLTAGIEGHAALRIAHALEYIAAQLGQISAKLDVIAKGSEKKSD